MRLIKLTQGQYSKVDDDDFPLLSKPTWQASYDKKRGVFLASRGVWNSLAKKPKTVLMAREIAKPKGRNQVDHINHDTLDNRKDNLRICTRSQNAMNQQKQNNNTSGFKGVCWSKHNRKWVSRIVLEGKTIHIGGFNSREDAGRAYDEKATEIYGKFAHLNFSGVK